MFLTLSIWFQSWIFGYILDIRDLTTGAWHTSLWSESVHENAPQEDRLSTGQLLCYSNDCFPLVLQCQHVRQYYHYRLMELLVQLGGLSFNVCLHLIRKGRWDSFSNTHQRWSGFSANVIRDYLHVTYRGYVTCLPAFLPDRFEEKVSLQSGEDLRLGENAFTCFSLSASLCWQVRFYGETQC